jgi:hypothetical protein
MSEAKSGDAGFNDHRLIMKWQGLSPDVANAHPGYGPPSLLYPHQLRNLLLRQRRRNEL